MSHLFGVDVCYAHEEVSFRDSLLEVSDIISLHHEVLPLKTVATHSLVF